MSGSGWIAAAGRLHRNAGVVLRAAVRGRASPDPGVAWMDVFEASPDVVFAKDLDGRYVVANAAFRSLSGLAEAVALRLRDGENPDDEVARLSVSARLKVIRTGEPVEIDLDVMHQTLRVRRTYSAVLSPLMRGGEIAGVVCFGRDITDRVEIEGGLRRERRRAEEAEAGEIGFMAAAAHDLRQPLQSAILLSEALAHSSAGGPAAKAASCLADALGGLKDLLDSLFESSHADRGAGTEPDVPLEPIMRDLLASWGAAAEKKGVRLSCDSGGWAVRSDAVLLRRVLRNLVENAVRHTVRGHVSVSCRSDGAGRAVIEVSDSGPGMPPGITDATWGRARNRGAGGGNMGIGPAIVRRLCRNLGHAVSLETRPGRGTVFSIGLEAGGGRPGAVPPGERAAPDPRPIPPGTRVLAIEDDELVALSLRSLVSAWGGQIRTAANEAEALAWVESGFRPNVILADWHLSGGRKDGGAVRSVRAALSEKVPAAVLTASRDGQALAAANAAGLWIIRKPVPATDLAAALDALVRGGGM